MKTTFAKYLAESTEPPFLTDHADIAAALYKLDRKLRPDANIYGIEADGSVTVFNTSVCIENIRMKRLPIRFNTVGSDFIIGKCGLVSLEGCPSEVGGSFYVSDNKIRSLVGGPRKVGVDYRCEGNSLEDLEGMPSTINGSFTASNNSLTSLKGGPTTVRGNCNISQNHLTSLEHAPRMLGKSLDVSENNIETLEGIGQQINNLGFVNGDGWLSMSRMVIKSGGLGLIMIENLQKFSIDFEEFGHSTKNEDPAMIIGMYLGKPDEIFECQAALIKAGFEETAKL